MDEATVIVSNTIENESEDAQELNITTTIMDPEGNEWQPGVRYRNCGYWE